MRLLTALALIGGATLFPLGRATMFIGETLARPSAALIQVEKDTSAPLTFNKDVLPILQKNCQTCHRPGQIAPMSFLTYQSTRPWAKAMKAAVVSRKMPPWFADPRYGHFANDRSLKQSDIDTLVKWVDGGALEGDPNDAPPAVQWPEDGWHIKPDVIVDGPGLKVPASGLLEWTWVAVPSGFTKDTWITSIEFRPSDLSITHHICLQMKPHTPGVEYNVPVWDDKQRDENGLEGPRPKGSNIARTKVSRLTAGSEMMGCYVPGMPILDFRELHAGKLIPAGTDFLFVFHYTPNGKEVNAHVQIGFTVAKEAPERKFVTVAGSSVTDADSFAIPPNAPNWESPPMIVRFIEDVELVWMMPHMHLRGKDMTYELKYADGTSQTVLSVPRYDFNWQLGYEVADPIKLPRGTSLIGTAHYDNSVNNKFNPNPNQTVYYGDMTWEEMMAPFFGVLVDKNVDSKKVFEYIRGSGGSGA
jgi:hypothetical protein